jgi:hypothetical protein
MYFPFKTYVHVLSLIFKKVGQTLNIKNFYTHGKALLQDILMRDIKAPAEHTIQKIYPRLKFSMSRSNIKIKYFGIHGKVLSRDTLW